MNGCASITHKVLNKVCYFFLECKHNYLKHFQSNFCLCELYYMHHANYFSLRCRTPLSLLANEVYRFECLRDANNTYIGKTIQHLATKVREHGTSLSAVQNHLPACKRSKSNFSCNNFSVVDSSKNDNDITVKEALHIKFKRPIVYTKGHHLC